MRLMKTATLAASLVGILLVMPHAFSQTTPDGQGRGDGLPPGIEDNQGLAEHGKGDTQGKHNGWTKEQEEKAKKDKEKSDKETDTKSQESDKK